VLGTKVEKGIERTLYGFAVKKHLGRILIFFDMQMIGAVFPVS